MKWSERVKLFAKEQVEVLKRAEYIMELVGPPPYCLYEHPLRVVDNGEIILEWMDRDGDNYCKHFSPPPEVWDAGDDLPEQVAAWQAKERSEKEAREQAEKAKEAERKKAEQEAREARQIEELVRMRGAGWVLSRIKIEEVRDKAEVKSVQEALRKARERPVPKKLTRLLDSGK